MKSKREVRKSIKQAVDNSPERPSLIGVVVGVAVLLVVVIYLLLKL